ADDLHQGGLARAIGADEPVPVAIAEFDADVLEKGLGAELDGEVVGGDHGGGGEKVKSKQPASLAGGRLPAPCPSVSGSPRAGRRSVAMLPQHQVRHAVFGGD